MAGAGTPTAQPIHRIHQLANYFKVTRKYCRPFLVLEPALRPGSYAMLAFPVSDSPYVVWSVVGRLVEIIVIEIYMVSAYGTLTPRALTTRVGFGSKKNKAALLPVVHTNTHWANPRHLLV